MTPASSTSPSVISRKWHRRSASACLPCSLSSASSTATVPRAFCVGIARVSASTARSGCMPRILLPWSALRSTNGPSGRSPHLPFERYPAQGPPADLLEQGHPQGARRQPPLPHEIQPLLPPKPQALRCHGLHRRASTIPPTKRRARHPSCGTPLATATGCTHRAHDPPLGRATAPPGSAAPTSCASLRCLRHHLRAKIPLSAPRPSSMGAPPPHGPASSQNPTAPITRAAALARQVSG